MSIPYTVGLTGTIASGKSSALLFFESQGIDVVCADTIAKQLTQKGHPALETIAAHFGPSILTNTGELNRKVLKACIIQNPIERRWLENYLHPQIRSHIEQEVQKANSSYVMVDIPLLTDRAHFPYLNRVLLLEIDERIQVERLMTRDDCSQERAEQMIALQPSITLRRALADDIIQNNESLDALHKKLQALHARYLKDAS